MREIKFRGKNQDTNEWVYGWYTKLTEGVRRFDAIISDGDVGLTRFYIHNQETIGQYTGLKDKNGVEIYEGDALNDASGKYMIVGWSLRFASYVLNREGWAFSHWFGESCDAGACEVIGNIHDNPELLK